MDRAAAVGGGIGGLSPTKRNTSLNAVTPMSRAGS